MKYLELLRNFFDTEAQSHRGAKFFTHEKDLQKPAS
jgi:hypothetical protein